MTSGAQTVCPKGPKLFHKVCEETTRLLKSILHKADKIAEMATTSGVKYAYRCLGSNGFKLSKSFYGQASQQWRWRGTRSMASMSAESQHKVRPGTACFAAIAYLLAASCSKSRRSGSHDVRDHSEGLLNPRGLRIAIRRLDLTPGNRRNEGRSTS